MDALWEFSISLEAAIVTLVAVCGTQTAQKFVVDVKNNSRRGYFIFNNTRKTFIYNKCYCRHWGLLIQHYNA